MRVGRGVAMEPEVEEEVEEEEAEREEEEVEEEVVRDEDGRRREVVEGGSRWRRRGRSRSPSGYPCWLSL